MQVTVSWTNDNFGEDRVLVARRVLGDAASESNIADLSPGATQHVDDSLVDYGTYEYRVGVDFSGTYYWSAWQEVTLVDVGDVPANSVLDNLDLTNDVRDLVDTVESFGLEVMATLEPGAIAQSTTGVNVLTGWGQHKMSSTRSEQQRVWIIMRDMTSGQQFRVHAQIYENTEGSANGIVDDRNDYDFEATDGTNVTTGTCFWRLTTDGASFSGTPLSNGPGAWAFTDTQSYISGNIAKPTTPLFGIGAWQGPDSAAVMTFGSTDYSNFRGLVAFSQGPDSGADPYNLSGEYKVIVPPDTVQARAL